MILENIKNGGLDGVEFEIATQKKAGFADMTPGKILQADTYLDDMDGKCGSEKSLVSMIEGNFRIFRMDASFELHKDETGGVVSYDLVEKLSKTRVAEITLDRQKEREKTRELEEEKDDDFEMDF